MNTNTSFPEAKKPTILVIDDDETHRLLARDCLEAQGYRILEAADGDSGLRTLHENTVDLVLLDVMMPGRDGYSTCREIRIDPTSRDIPVMMVTGSEDLDAVDRAFSAKADDFVTKPVHWPLLPYRVRFTLRNRDNENALRFALLKSQAADEAKSQFMSAMGHELRTPLNAIIGFSEIIAKASLGPDSSDKYVEYGGHILQGGKRLLGMINAILDMVKLQERKLALRLEPVDLTRLLEDLRATLEEQCVAAGHGFSLQAEGDVPPVNGDSTRIGQCLYNLISNAAKFTPTGGRIEIVVRREAGGGAELVVSDNGIGMNAEEIAIALQPFRQVDGRLSRAHEGAGLGLPIARALVELHSGSLTVESEPGRGTTIHLKLPAFSPVADAAPSGLRQAS